MQVSNAFADIVRRTAFKGYRFDVQSRRIEPDLELNSFQTNKLIELAISSYGYKNHIDVERDIVQILTSVGEFNVTHVQDIELFNLESGTLVGFGFRDGTQLRLIYDVEGRFIVLSDTSGVLRRGDNLNWLSCNLSIGDRIIASVVRNGAVYPDPDTCYYSDYISDVGVVYVSPYVPLYDATVLKSESVIPGSAYVFSKGPNINGIFDSSGLTAEASEAMFSLDLARMEYSLNPKFISRIHESESLMDLLARSCEIVSGNNPRLLQTIEPGHLSLTNIRRNRCLKISKKLKVSMSPCI